MIIAHAVLRVRPERVEAYEATFRELRAHVLANEPGTVFFELCRDPQQAHGYQVFEAYRDEAALKAHAATDYYRAASAEIVRCLEGDHLDAIARQGLTAPSDIYRQINSLKIEVFEALGDAAPDGP
jgi:quinol monooxygenase YgiN